MDDREREREQQLVSAALDGDKSAFGELVDRLKRSLFGVCMSYLRDEAEAMDQVQDTFLKAYTELSKFRRDTNFRAWVHRIARNGCIDRIRRQRVRRAGELDDQVSSESLEEGSLPSVGTFGRTTPLQDMARNELGARLQAAVDQLPEAHRMCVIMCDVEGMSYQEIAEALEIPKGTVMSRLFYARRKLQAELHDFRPTDGGMP